MGALSPSAQQPVFQSKVSQKEFQKSLGEGLKAREAAGEPLDQTAFDELAMSILRGDPTPLQKKTVAAEAKAAIKPPIGPSEAPVTGKAAPTGVVAAQQASTRQTKRRKQGLARRLARRGNGSSVFSKSLLGG